MDGARSDQSTTMALQGVAEAVDREKHVLERDLRPDLGEVDPLHGLTRRSRRARRRRGHRGPRAEAGPGSPRRTPRANRRRRTRRGSPMSGRSCRLMRSPSGRPDRVRSSSPGRASARERWRGVGASNIPPGGHRAAPSLPRRAFFAQRSARRRREEATSVPRPWLKLAVREGASDCLGGPLSWSCADLRDSRGREYRETANNLGMLPTQEAKMTGTPPDFRPLAELGCARYGRRMSAAVNRTAWTARERTTGPMGAMPLPATAQAPSTSVTAPPALPAPSANRCATSIVLTSMPVLWHLRPL